MIEVKEVIETLNNIVDRIHDISYDLTQLIKTLTELIE